MTANIIDRVPASHVSRSVGKATHQMPAEAGGPHFVDAEITSCDVMLVCLLGNFRLLRRSKPLKLHITGKAVALLSAVALRRESGVPRETLLEALWPEQDTMLAAVSLNSLVYSLHRRLRQESCEPTPVICANGVYFLNTAAGYGTDIALFESHVASGNRLAAAHRNAEAANHYVRAIDLYQGDLFTGADVYAVIERERFRASYLSVLSWLADQAYRDGDYAAALGHALRVLACDPCREDAHRVVMRARVRRGERAQALRQYRLCELVLRREFDAEPEVLTTELFNRIRLDPSGI